MKPLVEKAGLGVRVLLEFLCLHDTLFLEIFVEVLMFKPKKPKWYEWIPFILLWMVLLPIAVLLIPYMYYLLKPIQRAIDEQPQYWQNWKEIKIKSKRSTVTVAHELLSGCSNRAMLDCQFRSEEELLRLEKFLKRTRPHRNRPLSIEEVVFYEFRRRWDGPGSRKQVWQLPVWIPQPAHAKV